MSFSRHRIRAYNSPQALIRELRDIDLPSDEVETLVLKSYPIAIKLEQFPIAEAQILQQEMTSVKGLAIAVQKSDAENDSYTARDLFLLANQDVFQAFVKRIREEPHRLKDIAQSMEQVVKNIQHDQFSLHSARFSWNLHHRTMIMGILNVTPDSFSDGGKFLQPEAAVERAVRMKEEGADIIDIGAESTRPDSDPISPQEELRRLMPVVKPLLKLGDLPVSIDTYKAEVANVMLAEGVDMINDISGFTLDCNMPGVLANHDVPVVIMHIPAAPKTMQYYTKYRSLISDILLFLSRSIEVGKQAGIAPDRIIIDPGIGFGKTSEQNLSILRLLPEFKSLGRPILIGVSRKSFIGKILNLPPEDRLEGTAAAVVAAILNGANLIRVHDVKEMVRVSRMADAISYELSAVSY